MKKIICLFAVLILYFVLFIFERETENTYKTPEFIDDNSPVINLKKDENKSENNGKNEVNAGNNTLLNKKENFYPPFIKKDGITLYINNPYDFEYPSDKTRSTVCKFLVNEIKNAKESINFAIYGIDSQDEIVNALNFAKTRGVDVRGVADSDEEGNVTYKDINKLKNIPVTYDNSRYIMHNKFFIIDNKFVLTGSMNITKTGCGGYNANVVAVVEDEKIKDAYKKEFEQMSNGIFKNKKINYSVKTSFDTKKIPIEAVFSPKGSIYDKTVSDFIKNAKNNIKISVFVLTRYDMVKDLIEAKTRGVEIKIIMDATGALNYKKQSEMLRREGIKVKVENWGGKNHEKTISIDDKILVMGSANFSYNASLRNDENTLIIYDTDITKFYNGYFDKLFASIEDKYLTEYPRAEGIESGNSCYDGIDNDFDGKIDLNDAGCVK